LNVRRTYLRTPRIRYPPPFEESVKLNVRRTYLRTPRRGKSERFSAFMRLIAMNTMASTERAAPLVEGAGLREFCAVEYPRLLGSLTLYCGDRAVAEELAQEALARACISWSKVRRMDAPGAWVNRVAINLANSHFRRKGAERRAQEKLEARAERAAPHQDHDLEMILRREVAALPRRQRAALVLRYFGDMSVSATADALGVPEGTIKRLTHDAIAALRKNPRLAGLEVNDD
jgi:RNA polymerase sigma factor (sigma-70 family)